MSKEAKNKEQNQGEGNRKTVHIGDKTFMLQNPGVRWYIKHTDQSKDMRGNLQFEKYVDGLLEMVVIQEVTMEAFDDVGKMRELVDEIENFLGAKE
jgi:hypothetical protein